MKWIVAMGRILIYFGLGVILFFGPWLSFWDNNFFLAHYSWISALGHNNFFRGAVSGIGLTNIWLALDEVRRFGHSAGSV
ncbi:MAG TPA: hypothetical protein VKW70_01215 [Terriglobia bacterium]|nr:hypothetical protein [Terriglobia bacterium]